VILVLYNDIVSQGRRKIGEIVRTDDYTIDPFIFQPLTVSFGRLSVLDYRCQTGAYDTRRFRSLAPVQ
jgi:hypothetical protein